jgi:hypothetical protein
MCRSNPFNNQVKSRGGKKTCKIITRNILKLAYALMNIKGIFKIVVAVAV